MRTLKLVDLKVGLEDLFANRSAALLTSAMGQAYAPLLEAKRQAILALPAALTGTPLAEQLGGVDDVHDGHGAALWHLAHSYLVSPTASAERKASAKRILEGLVPGRDVLRASYADQVSAGQSNQPKLDALTADLAAFPLADGGTALEWASGFVGAAAQMGSLLGQRADIASPALAAQRAQGATIRASTIGLLNRLRESIQEAVAADLTLPRDLEAQIFNYFDLLEEARTAASASATTGDAEPSLETSEP